MAQEVNQAVTDIVAIFTNIFTVLTPTGPQPSATQSLLTDANEIRTTGNALLAAPFPDKKQLNLLLSIVKGFGRHLSEVEQTIYEEIGNDRLNQLLTLADSYSDPYNVIYDYLGA